jgi:hypothetical protein
MKTSNPFLCRSFPCLGIDPGRSDNIAELKPRKETHMSFADHYFAITTT